jgi:hypothetical protein
MSSAPLSLHLEILPAPQRRLWDELGAVPAEFTLYGGTAIALQLGHRESIDFDFFGQRPFDADTLANALPFFRGAEIVQRAPDTLTARVDRNGAVLVSFFATPHLRRVAAPLVAADTKIKIASLLDLAAMKVDVVQKRAEKKDYIDLDALLRNGVDLSRAIAAARIAQGPEFNPLITLKALAFFGDGDLAALPDSTKQLLRDAVRAVDIDQLPELSPYDDPDGSK